MSIIFETYSLQCQPNLNIGYSSLFDPFNGNKYLISKNTKEWKLNYQIMVVPIFDIDGIFAYTLIIIKLNK